MRRAGTDAAPSTPPGGAVPDRARLCLAVQGFVQGVGFRPHVYRLANESGLAGWVSNDARGVFVEVEGERSGAERFLARLRAELPPAARIDALDAAWLPPVGYTTFEIRTSDEAGPKTTPVLPDLATCPDCLAETRDAAERRHRYPFTNCTNCGPRFTIVRSLPYDRTRTTMAGFSMCPACREEYENPRDRRFHAQPVACPACGPTLSWRDARSGLEASGNDALLTAAAAIRAGGIVAVKGLGGFHLMADATDDAALARLRARKRREEKPLALMVRDLTTARALCEVPVEAARALESPQAPILLLRRRPGTAVSSAVAPGMDTLGVMLPATPLHHDLTEAVGHPIVSTSGNLVDEPICTDEKEAALRLAGIADGYLVHDRPIARHVDDSVGLVLDGEIRLLRRARGYAPAPVLLPGPVPTILAVGAHQKNTVALSRGRRVFVGQHIGDLETPEALAAFERVIADCLDLYGAEPEALACDLHPDYVSSRWARENAAGRPLVAVQHHHAHLAACLAENGIAGEALGVTWDGTGYGTDGTIWGGEFLLGSAAGFRRVGRLRPFALPGGAAAVRQPRRSALALLWELEGPRAFERAGLAPVASFPPGEREVLARMLERGVNAPVTTSVGRMFDAVAALAGVRQSVAFEGQAAMLLEHAASDETAAPYPVEIETRPAAPPGPLAAEAGESSAGSMMEWDWRETVAAILDDLAHGAGADRVASRFHATLVEVIVAVARRTGVPRIALTGGCFQNRRLTEAAAARLRAGGFEVLLHRQVPPNDGGISLGQIAAAAARVARP